MQAEEEESIYLDVGSPPDEIRGGDEIEESITESSSSDQSNDSAGSFAFPVYVKPTYLCPSCRTIEKFMLVVNLLKICRLRFEGIGSPVQMPRSEDLQLRKHKSRGLSFRCCRF